MDDVAIVKGTKGFISLTNPWTPGKDGGPHKSSIIVSIEDRQQIIDKKVQSQMRKILKEIQNGKFAKEWMKENKKGRKKFNKFRNLGQNHEIESVGIKLRKMMPWIAKNKIVR